LVTSNALTGTTVGGIAEVEVINLGLICVTRYRQANLSISPNSPMLPCALRTVGVGLSDLGWGLDDEGGLATCD